MTDDAKPQPELTKIMLIGATATVFEAGAQVVDPLSTTDSPKTVVKVGKLKGGSYRIDYDDGTFDLLCHAPVICRYEDIDGIKCFQCGRPVSVSVARTFEGEQYCASCAIPLQRKKVVAEARAAEGRVPLEDEDISEKHARELDAAAV